MAAVGTSESLAELSEVLELFFKGLAECGLLTAYLVRLKGPSVDFSVQIKYQYLLLQFVRSLQNVLAKIPSVPGHEFTKEIGTQTPEEESNIEVNVPHTATSYLPEQFGSLVKRHELSKAGNQLEWVGNERNEIKSGLRANFVTNCKTLHESAHHHAALATLASDGFVVPANSSKPGLIKDCIKRDIDGVISAMEEKHLLNSVKGIESLAGYTEPSLENITITELNSFVMPNTLLLETYDGDNNIQCNGIDDPSADFVQIFVASPELPTSASVPMTVVNQVEEEEAEGSMGTSIYVCELCDRTFESLGSLEVHVTTKHHTLGYCDLCQQDFGSVQGLQEHCRMKHKGCFTCVVCGKRFFTKLSFQRHMDIHADKRRGVCKICGKTFSRMDHLQKHYMTHRGHRPYRCNICPRQFISPSQLRLHQKVHSSVRSDVGDRFPRTGKLRHLNNKRFHCTMCKKDYAEKRDLTKHLIIHIT